MPALVHQIFGEDETETAEYGSGDFYKDINFNRDNTGHLGDIAGTPQKAVRMFEGVLEGDEEGYIGFTFALPPPLNCPTGGMTPNDVDVIKIDIEEHDDTADAHSNDTPERVAELRRIVAHEIGHSVHIDDRPSLGGVCSDGANVGTGMSIMKLEWSNGAGFDVPAGQYNAEDIAQIRVRIP
jgi:hypothetical protein